MVARPAGTVAAKMAGQASNRTGSAPMRSLLLFALLATAPVAAQQTATAPLDPTPRVLMVTSHGRIVLELDRERAPRTVANFLQYAHEGHYNGTIFHRVIDNFLIQGGRYTPDLQRKPVRESIPSEADNGLSNLRGTIAAARAPSDPDSATSEFFINVVDNPRLDYTGPDSPYTRGYTVFGRVVSGMEVVDRIRAVPTEAREPLGQGVPVEPVIIERMEVLEPGSSVQP